MTYTLKAKLTADAKGFISGIEKAQKGLGSLEKFSKNIGGKLQDFGKSVSNIGSQLTNKITKPALIAGTAVAGITLAKGFQRLVGIDTARAKLVGLGHDAKSVEAIMGSALDSVKGTSYGLEEAATTAANAVAAGIEPGKELTRYLSLTGDAAAIAGSEMGEMGSILNKVQTANKAYNGELQQLSDRGLPIYQWLAKEANTTADAIFDMASQGEISSEMLMNSIENNIGGAAKKMGEESFTAGLANMWAAVGRLGASFLDAGGEGGGFFSTLKPMIADFTDRIDDMGDIAQKAGEKFGEMFTNFIEKVKEAKSWYDNLSPAIQNIINKTMLWGTIGLVAIGPILKVIGTLITFSGTLSTAFGIVAGAIGAISTPVLIVVGAIGLLVGAFIGAYSTSEKFRDIISQVFEGIKSLISTAIDNFNASFARMREGFEPVLEKLKQLFEDLQPILLIIGGIVGGVLAVSFGIATSIFNGVVSAIMPLIGAIIDLGSFITNVVMTVVALLTGDFTGALEYWEKATQNSIDFFISLWDTVIGFFSGFVTSIINFFTDLYMTIVGNSIVPDMVNAIIDWFKNLGKWAIDLVKGLVTGVVNWFVSLYTGAVNNFKKLWSSATTLFNNVKNAITNPIKTAYSSVTGFFKSIYTGAKNNFNSLKNSATTIFNNVKNAMTKPIDSAMNLIKGALDKVKGFFSGLKLKFPKISMPKMPKFSLTGKFSLMPPSVPKVGIKWNAQGGIMDRRTIFGASGNTLMGGGEAGPEAILPLNSKVLGGIGKGIASTMSIRDNNNQTEPKTVKSGDIVFNVDGYELARIQEPHLDSMFGESVDLTSYMNGVR